MRAILPLRLERGSSLVLGGEQPADTETLSVISTTRQAMIDAFNKMQIYLRAQDVPSVSLTLDRLNTAQATMNALRLRIDEALKLPKTQRDATLLPAALKRFQELLDALSATTDAVDAAIPRSDAMLQRYLVLKHAA